MSGGSFNYFERAVNLDGVGVLFNEGRKKTLEEMRDICIEELDAPDAAAEIETILATIKQAEVLLETRFDRLAGIFHGIEWERSADWGKDQVMGEIEKYREGLK